MSRRLLNAMGIPAESDQIITPLAPLIAYLQACSIRNAYLLGNARLAEYLRQALPRFELTADFEALLASLVGETT